MSLSYLLSRLGGLCPEAGDWPRRTAGQEGEALSGEGGTRGLTRWLGLGRRPCVFAHTRKPRAAEPSECAAARLVRRVGGLPWCRRSRERSGSRGWAPHGGDTQLLASWWRRPVGLLQWEARETSDLHLHWFLVPTNWVSRPCRREDLAARLARKASESPLSAWPLACANPQLEGGVAGSLGTSLCQDAFGSAQPSRGRVLMVWESQTFSSRVGRHACPPSRKWGCPGTLTR